MENEILSVAIYEPLPGREEDSLATMRDLLAALTAGAYSRDRLFREGSQYLLFRYWKSEEARRAALEDTAVLRCWARLAEQIEIVKVYERLEDTGLR